MTLEEERPRPWLPLSFRHPRSVPRLSASSLCSCSFCNRSAPCSSEPYLSIATLPAQLAEGACAPHPTSAATHQASCLRFQPLPPSKLIHSLDFCLLSYDSYPRFILLVWKAPLSLQAWNKQPPCHLPWDLKDLRTSSANTYHYPPLLLLQSSHLSKWQRFGTQTKYTGILIFFFGADRRH